jgi:hypothetical protein
MRWRRPILVDQVLRKHTKRKACVDASQAQVDRSLISSHVQNQQAMLEQERRGREEALNAAGRLANELSENVRACEAHTAQAAAATQQL